MGSHPATKWLAVFMTAIAALAILGLVAFWPRGEGPDLGDRPERNFVDATISDLAEAGCEGIEVTGPTQCRRYTARLTSGSGSGSDVQFSVLPTDVDIPELDVDDQVVLVEFPDTPDPEFRYAFFEYQRSTPLLWLVVAFVVVVVLFGRMQGVRALAGLAISLAVLVAFLVPALLRDSPAVPVALAATVIVAFVAIYLAHGVGLASTIALAGTLVSLAATTLLALVVASATQLSGLASHESQVLRITAEAVDLRGLLIAGIVVGALGVLDDVTVSQVSTVAALRRANPTMGAGELYREATRVGRDHVASTVNTLVLAYAGASLPLLLFFAQGSGVPVTRVVTGELVAMEVVRMLVGSIGLVLSVPVTTRLAAVILSHSDPLGDDGHGHGHTHSFEDLREPEPAELDYWGPEEPREPAPWF